MSNVPSTVAVPQVSGTPQALIDNNIVSTSASAAAQRQVTSIGDPSAGANIAAVDSQGRLNVAGQNIIPNETNPTVTSATNGSQLFSSNPNAKYRFFQNTTNIPAWVKLSGGNASVGTGMLIGPYGTYEMSPGNGNMITGQITAISTSGSLEFYCCEGT